MTIPYSGAILLLNCTPDPETVEAISRDTATDHLHTDSYNFHLTSTLPEGTPVDVVDQYTAQMRDLPAGSTYLLVYPVAESTQL